MGNGVFMMAGRDVQEIARHGGHKAIEIVIVT
jgi:hypothetical protein